MTTNDLIDILNEEGVSISFDGLHYYLYCRNIPRAFFADYQRIDSLHTAGILDDRDAAEAVLKLAAKYER